MPEADEVEVNINPDEVRVDLYCASGPGGQHVNTTQSAVRLTHEPTGIVVQCQDEKSQMKNKAKAMKVLRSRILQVKREEQEAEISGNRRSQVGSGDRSEKFRTYNFPQNRVTTHTIHFTVHNLDGVLNGEIDEIINQMIALDQAEKLRTLE
jgi:peptide chain release factor 1